MACGHCGGGGGGVGASCHACGATTCGNCGAGIMPGVVLCGSCGTPPGNIVDWVRDVKADRRDLAQLDATGQGSSDKAKADLAEVRRDRSAIIRIPVVIGLAGIIELVLILTSHHH